MQNLGVRKIVMVAIGYSISLTVLCPAMAEQLEINNTEPLVEISPEVIADGAMMNVWADPEGGFITVGGEQIWRLTDEGQTEIFRGKKLSLVDVWGASSESVYAVAKGGEILHFDGNTWQIMLKVKSRLSGIWGNSESDVFAVGTQGVILHYDGASWMPMNSGIEENLMAIHGVSSSTVFAVGTHGTVVRFDGDEWLRVDSGALPSDLWTVWVASADEVFVGGNGGLIARLNDQGWTIMLSDTGRTDHIFDLAGVSPNELYALSRNHRVLRFDGIQWTQFSRTNRRFWPFKMAIGSSGSLVILGGYGEFRRLPGEPSGTMRPDGAVIRYVPEESR